MTMEPADFYKPPPIVDHGEASMPPIDVDEQLFDDSPPPDIEAELAKELAAGSKAPVLATLPLTGIDLAKPLPPLDYISRSLAMTSGAGAPHCFGGFGFSGKTVIAQSMMLSLSSRRGIWRAYEGPGRQLKCSHVDNEQGLALSQRRYQRLATALGEKLEEIGDHLRLFVYPKLSNGERVYLKKEHRAAWQEMMVDRDVLLVDSFAASRDGAVKENESEVRRGLDMLGELSEETKCRPLVIHHANKGGEDGERDSRFALRGSGGIFDAFDSVYLLSGQKGEPVKVEQIKARTHGEPIDDFAVVITDVAGEDDPKWGLAVSVHGVELIAEKREAMQAAKEESRCIVHMDRIRSALADGKRLPRNDLVAIVRLNSRDFARAWTRLLEVREVNTERVKQGRTFTLLHFLEGPKR